jgi:hypothetical protein
MSKDKLEPIQLTAYFSERTASKEDLEFIYKKLDSGLQPADLLRNAIRNYRKTVEEEDNGVLNNVDSFLEKLSNKLIEKLASGKFVPKEEVKDKLKENEEEINKKAEEAFNKRREKLAALGLSRKRR